MRALFLTMCLSLRAFASEGHEAIALAALISRSTHVLVVEPATPATRTSEIAIAPKGGSPEKYPPYSRTQHRFIVKASLKQPDGGKAVLGQTITVDEADHSTRVSVHRRYYLEGVRKIPLYAVYEPLPAVDAGASRQLIVFLRASADGFEFTAARAFEPVAHQAVIEAQLAAP